MEPFTDAATHRHGAARHVLTAIELCEGIRDGVTPTGRKRWLRLMKRYKFVDALWVLDRGRDHVLAGGRVRDLYRGTFAG